MANEYSNFIEAYLTRFGHGTTISLNELWAEMDRVWDEFKLDNTKRISQQNIKSFYSHPVWILNGLFTEADPTSQAHRQAVATYIEALSRNRNRLYVADYGGGSGALAKIVSNRTNNVVIDIIEPCPFDYFVSRLSSNNAIQFRDDLEENKYDVVIAQDVLEHVDDPIGAALQCIKAVREGGFLIFLNCFYPVIKCHLPSTFYLRHTFRYVICSSTIAYCGCISGAKHAQVFKKYGKADSEGVRNRNRYARLLGPMINQVIWTKRLIGNGLRNVGLRR